MKTAAWRPDLATIAGKVSYRADDHAGYRHAHR